MKRAARSAVLALACALGGCGSLVGTVTQPSPYVGVTLEASYLVNTNASSWFWLTAAWLVLDLPLSAVMDTLLLPFTLLVAAEGSR